MVLALACMWNISTIMCWGEPAPAEPKLILSALMSLSSSSTELMPELAPVTSRNGALASGVMGVRSFTGS
ncbi:hypothetical protein D3C81_2225320 [compost metagenome]